MIKVGSTMMIPVQFIPGGIVNVIWASSFTGTTVSVIAPKEQDAGKIEIKIDGKTKAVVDLAETGARKAQQVVYEVNRLSNGKHSINIINRGKGKVAIDALIIK
jgi:hypothetical protein